jgi:hypothetical protein
LRRHVGITGDGLELRRAGVQHKVVRWCVVPA